MTLHRVVARQVAEELQLECSSPDRRLLFHGHTMRPFLQDGDQLVTEPVTRPEVRPGDIIVYRHGGAYPARRVTERLPERCALRVTGDNREMDTGWIVDESDLLARVTARVRDGRQLEATQLRWRLAALRSLCLLWLSNLASSRFRRRILRRALRRLHPRSIRRRPG